MTHRLLIAEDEANYRKLLRLMLADLDVDITEAEDGAAAWAALERGGFDLVITDVNMPKLGGLELLERVQQAGGPPVVVITAYASVDDAVAAIQRGAIDYLTKPFDEKRLLLTLQRALRMTELLSENARLVDDVRRRYDFSSILGRSEAITKALQIAAKVAQSEAAVLLLGESGTGKELFARAIHINSKRSRGPFVAVNCAAIPDTLLEAELFGAEAGAFTGATKKRKGRVESARGGTLFLDEIGDLPLLLQAKLLRLVQEKTFTPLGADKDERADVRFVFATHRDLAAMVAAGTFREDLRFRVSVLPVQLPALRDRGDDVLLIADAVSAQVCASMGKRPLPFTDAAQAALRAHRFPGNVRELANVVERACILCDAAAIDDVDLELPPAPTPPDDPAVTGEPPLPPPTQGAASARFALPEQGIVLEDVERDLVRQALERAGGNKSQAARLLGLTRATLRYRLEKYGLDA